MFRFWAVGCLGFRIRVFGVWVWGFGCLGFPVEGTGFRKVME